MMNSAIPFAELRRTLEGLGFRSTRQPTHWLFEHATPDTLLVFRLYRPGDKVLAHDLVGARTMLDERGLLNANEFDRLLSKAPA